MKNCIKLIEALLITSIIGTVIGCGGGNTTTFKPASKENEEITTPEFKD